MTRTLRLLLLLFSLPGPAWPADTPVDLAKEKVLYVVGYAHLDTQWRWDYPTTIRHYIPATLRENFKLFEKYPEYLFNFTGAIRYMMMAEYYPQDFARLKELIAAGRWKVVGSSVDEGDASVPSAESLIRQVLYGNDYFRKTFGQAGVDFMLPDCFGFPASLPSILAHCGIQGFVTQKLTWGSAVGVPFNVGVWEGLDGSSIVAVLNPGAYVHRLRTDLSRDAKWIERIEQLGKSSGVFTDYHFYGVGDRGGAPDAESVEWLIRSVRGDGPIRVVAAASDQLFRDLTPELSARLPRYRGDLLLTQHSAGTLTSQAAMKRWNRKNELLADGAERAAVIAAGLGGSAYPSAKLHSAWLRVLASQMHDILPGTSIPEAYNYSWNDEVIALNGFAAALEESVGAVTRALDTQGEGTSLVVYNPLSVVREDVVEARLSYGDAPPPAIRVFDPQGNEVPSQFKATAGGDVELCFVARVPAVGFAVYDVRRAEAACELETGLKISPGSLENSSFRVRLDQNGDVASIFDKRTGREVLTGPARLELLTDAPQNWPAWNMDWKDLQAPARGHVTGPPRIRVLEQGPARISLQVTRDTASSRFVQSVRLSAGSGGERVEFDCRFDWRTAGTCLKAAFPLTVQAPEATYNWGMGTIRRGNNDPKKYEVPSHQWFDLTDTTDGYGVAVLEDCKYGSDKPSDSTLRLTLLRTPACRSYHDQASQDFGFHTVRYALAPHRGDWRRAHVPYQAARLNQPLLAFRAPPHPGPLGRSMSCLVLSTPQVMVRALKKAENSDEVILRLQELDGRPATGVRVGFGLAFELLGAREVNGQELALGSATVRDGALIVNLRANQPRAFALRLRATQPRLSPPRSQTIALAFNQDGIGRDGEPEGDFDGQGRKFPAEMVPARLESDGIRFDLGPTSGAEENVLACQGQTLELPPGDFNRLYLLAAASGGDVEATFHIDGARHRRTIQEWTGMVGQWDRRIWHDTQFVGLKPGFIKRDRIAWFSTHRHLADGSNDPYVFSYLFKYRFDLPAGAQSITLPDDPRVKILAATVAWNENDATLAAQYLYDTLAEERPVGIPYLASQDGAYGTGHFVDRVSIELASATEGAEIRFTTDGSDPDLESPVYEKPLLFDRPTTLKARAFKKGLPPSRLLVEGFQPVVPIPASDPGSLSPGVIFSYYEVENLRALPDFDSLTPQKTGVQSGFQIDSRSRHDDFCFRFHGFIEVADTGLYVFYLRSDDGSQLSIGDQLVVDHDGLHGHSEKSGFLALKAGRHPITVSHFERGGDESLEVLYQGPGVDKQPIPAAVLFHRRP